MNIEFHNSFEVADGTDNKALVALVDTLGSDDAFTNHLSDLAQDLSMIEGHEEFDNLEAEIRDLRRRKSC